MGDIKVKIKIANGADKFLSKIGRGAKEGMRMRDVEALVRPDEMMSLIPADLVEGLGLEIISRRVFRSLDDRRLELPVAGCVSVTVAGREMITDCLVGPPGCWPILGHIVMTRLDLVCDFAKGTVIPRSRRMVINMRRLSCADGFDMARQTDGLTVAGHSC